MIVANSNELAKYTHKKTAVALGSFDAIHKGHIAIIGEAVRYAKQNDMLSMVQLFETPPSVLSGSESVNSLEKRISIIENLGADIAVIERFDDKFKSVEYQDFVLEYLKNRYNSGMVTAGANYRFGHFAKGDSKALVKLCGQLGIKTKIVNCIEWDGAISSTRIREYIRNGNVDMAHMLMARPYRISGKVVHGSKLGRSIGFPTANIDVPCGQVLPMDGVYASKAIFDGKTYDSITNVGAKPTVECNKKNIETFIFDFEGNLYDKTIEIEFLKRIRDIKRFNNLNELKIQLEADKAVRVNMIK